LRSKVGFAESDISEVAAAFKDRALADGDAGDGVTRGRSRQRSMVVRAVEM